MPRWCRRRCIPASRRASTSTRRSGPTSFEHLGRDRGVQPARRAARPRGRLEIHTGPDYFERMLREHPGNVVVLSGRNRGEDRSDRGVGGRRAATCSPTSRGSCKSADLPKLEAALADADREGVVAYDIMTERFEVTTILQRALVNDRGGVRRRSSRAPTTEPGVYMESVHHLMKVVPGAPNIRPAWFFDTAEQGEGFNDIGTHLVDLVQWTLFPDQAIDYRADVKVLAAQRWPTTIPKQEFQRVTGEPAFPAGLSRVGQGRRAASTTATRSSPTRVRGVHTKLNVIWDWEPPAGSGDTHFAVYRGHPRARRSAPDARPTATSRSSTCPGERRQRRRQVLAAVQARLAALQPTYPGVGVEDRGAEIHVTIPDAFRVGHEAHFAQVTTKFLQYLRDRKALPAWERPEHAGEVLRDDDGHGDEPAEPAERRSTARALSRPRTSRRVARRTNLPDAASYISRGRSSELFGALQRRASRYVDEHNVGRGREARQPLPGRRHRRGDHRRQRLPRHVRRRSDVVGGRSATYERGLAEAREWRCRRWRSAAGTGRQRGDRDRPRLRSARNRTTAC